MEEKPNLNLAVAVENDGRCVRLCSLDTQTAHRFLSSTNTGKFLYAEIFDENLQIKQCPFLNTFAFHFVFVCFFNF